MPRPPKTIHTLEGNAFKWVDITANGQKEIDFLGSAFQFHPLDIKDCLPPLQRPKLIARDDYIFLILNLPVFARDVREITPYEVDFFIGKDFLVTVRGGPTPALENFYQLLESDNTYKEKLLLSPTAFIEQIFDELIDTSFPMLLHISNEIEALQRIILKGYSRETMEEILRLKNNIVAFKKTAQPHHDLFSRLKILFPHYFPMEGATAHSYDRLITHATEIWDNLNTYREAIDAIQDTHTTLISFRLNEVVKTLTIFSIILSSVGVVTAILSTGAISTPIVDAPNGFWKLLLFLGGIVAIAIFWLQKKRWI